MADIININGKPSARSAPEPSAKSTTPMDHVNDAICVIDQCTAVLDMLTSAVCEAPEGETLSLSVRDSTLANSLYAALNLLDSLRERLATARSDTPAA